MIRLGRRKPSFGMEDRLQSQTERPIKTFGMEWESSLYALSKIESRFRKDSDIRYGNTHANCFIDNRFNVSWQILLMALTGKDIKRN